MDRESGESEENGINILELAEDAGILVILDGRIGRTEYRSVHGTLDAFRRFVQALESALANADESGGPRCRDNLPGSLRQLDEMAPKPLPRPSSRASTPI